MGTESKKGDFAGNKLEKNGRTRFMNACAEKSHIAAAWLIMTGQDKIDINFQDEDGNTALMMASKYCSRTVWLLLEKFPVSIDTQLTNVRGRTAEMIAKKHQPDAAKLIGNLPVRPDIINLNWAADSSLKDRVPVSFMKVRSPDGETRMVPVFSNPHF